jgi:hypothetical protein
MKNGEYWDPFGGFFSAQLTMPLCVGYHLLHSSILSELIDAQRAKQICKGVKQ